MVRAVTGMTTAGGQKGRRNELGLSGNVTDTRKTIEQPELN